MSLQVVLLAGGKGTRLRPYTTVIPKPLMPVGELPILEILLRQLQRAGVREAFLAVGHLAHLITAFFGDGERLGVRLHYSLEDKPLGTAGPVGLLLDRLGDDFAIMNGDLLTTLDYARAFAAHLESGAAATICTYPREVKIDFGVLETDASGALTRYVEKPTHHFDVSMGIYMFKKSAVAPLLQPGERIDIPDLVRALQERGERVMTHRAPCYWLDIGRPEDYQEAQEVFERRQAEFLPRG
jgi:NDP-sugar pyrophosphorylase family protein